MISNAKVRNFGLAKAGYGNKIRGVKKKMSGNGGVNFEDIYTKTIRLCRNKKATAQPHNYMIIKLLSTADRTAFYWTWVSLASFCFTTFCGLVCRG